MTEDDKALLLQELIRVHRMYRAGKFVDEDAHVWIEQQYAALHKHQIAEAMRSENIEELPEIQFHDDSTPGGGGG